MLLEDRMARMLDRAVSGEKFREEIEDWTTSCSEYDHGLKWYIIEMERNLGDRGVAEFRFLIIEENGYVSFGNYHRLCPKGTGTPSLKQLESSFAALSMIRQQPIRAGFTVFQQKNTERWLQRNHYTHDGSVYVKEFVPKPQTPF